jgi:uncharacterized protein (UPF0305 family)
MTDEIDEIDFSADISKNELLSVLKRVASQMGMNTIIRANTFIREDAKYMQAGYREDYIQRFIRAFILRLKDIKEDKGDYLGQIDKKKLKEFLKVLENQRKEAKSEVERCFLKIARIISIYAAFIREESIHPVGTKFPGGFQVRYERGEYLCPVKQRQLDTPSALCRFCVSKQDESAL